MNEQIILRDDSKALSVCNRIRLFEGEKNVDYFQILIPKMYNDINLSQCDARMVYITPDGKENSILINENLQDELYEDCLVYLVLIDETFTTSAGELKLYLSFTSVKNSSDIVLKTSTAVINMDKHPSGTNTSVEEKKDIIDEVLLRSKEAVDKVEVNRKYLDEMEKKSTDTIENITTVGEAQINAINEVSKGKLSDINGTAQAQVDALNRTAKAQIESINNVAKQNINNETNSIVQAARAQIEGINNVADARIFGINQVASGQINAIIDTASRQISAINNTATSQINAINNTAQAQSKAIELQASKIYNNLGIWIGTATLKTREPSQHEYYPYIIPRTGKYIRLDSMVINGSEVEFNETNYLEVRLSSNSDGKGNISGILKIKETGKNYSLESYGSVYKYILLVPHYSSGGLDCTIKYTLIEYDVKAEILALQQALIGVDELIGGDDNE